MRNRDIVVIGGSSGATVPLRTILGALPADLPAALFIVLHIPARSLGLLATVTAAASRLPVRAAADGMAIRPGTITLGVPDHHLILTETGIRLGRGPRENMARPSIDPLFRSAAAAFGPRVIGILLSGLLNDGASGLEAIKSCGGLTLVQDPADALADEMPRSALEALEVDLTLSAARIGDVLSDLVRGPAGPRLPVSPELRLEIDVAAGERIDSDVLRRIADPAALTCPHCSGVLSQVRDAKPLRFRCQVGHAFSAEAVAKEQEGAVDEAMRVALRIIEERAELVRRMARDGLEAGRMTVAAIYEERAAEYRRYAETIRKAVLLKRPSPEPSGDEGAQET
ncbi:chemotaxis protein CheB [Methylobacterium currus]|uniref:protein-glutamate methylesterase n=1 Tax=Methylobacterium currus TaxID=2051553 RepID=A0A2R4WH66_9HYPH|nr:chemotaxis protein CheB [Methylobacterium currus]AWB20867.1 chemotaxis protein CheB [Methylobacterium currus]UHC14299.1 chemotaxis protein CheB [Methylobacterium currus]